MRCSGRTRRRRRRQLPIDAQILEKYVGAYELRPGFVATITREGARLFVQATGQERFEIFPSAADEFFLDAVDARITFLHTVNVGNVGKTCNSDVSDGLVLHQGGRDVIGKRIH